MSITKGKWTAHIPRLLRPDRPPYDRRTLVVHPDGERIIACCSTGIVNKNGRIPQEEIEANAIAIAALPALLSATKRLVDECGGNPPDWLREAHDEAVEAINAATTIP